MIQLFAAKLLLTTRKVSHFLSTRCAPKSEMIQVEKFMVGLVKVCSGSNNTLMT